MASVRNPIKIQGCLLGKYSQEQMVPGVRLEDYCRGDCANCGFNVLEEARRRQLLRSGALEEGPDGLKRLYLGEEDNTSSGADAPPSPQGEGFEKEEML